MLVITLNNGQNFQYKGHIQITFSMFDYLIVEHERYDEVVGIPIGWYVKGEDWFYLENIKSIEGTDESNRIK